MACEASECMHFHGQDVEVIKVTLKELNNLWKRKEQDSVYTAFLKQGNSNSSRRWHEDKKAE